jgi:hypothetical protein
LQINISKSCEEKLAGIQTVIKKSYNPHKLYGNISALNGILSTKYAVLWNFCMALCIFPIYCVSDAQWFYASFVTFQLIQCEGFVTAHLVSRICTETVNGEIFGDPLKITIHF